MSACARGLSDRPDSNPCAVTSTRDGRGQRPVRCHGRRWRLPISRAVVSRAREPARAGGAHRKLAENSGVDEGVVIERMRNGGGSFGFDALHRTYVDLVEARIIDATKAVRVALENAASVASVLPLTEATLVEIPEERPAPARPEREG